jgi:hypothetical protein
MTTESFVQTGEGGTSFVGADATLLFKAIVLRSGLGLLEKGIRPNTGWKLSGVLAATGRITGKTYTRSRKSIPQARADLTKWIDAMNAAMPVVER